MFIFVIVCPASLRCHYVISMADIKSCSLQDSLHTVIKVLFVCDLTYVIVPSVSCEPELRPGNPLIADTPRAV